MTTSRTWEPGQHVVVSLPYGTAGVTLHPGRISRIQEPGPYREHRTIKVIFDDPLVYGGMGAAWVSPAVLSVEGEEPPPPERETE